MNPIKDFVHAVPVPVHLFSELTYDMSGGEPIDPNLPRAVPVPVNVWPERTFDMTGGQPLDMDVVRGVFVPVHNTVSATFSMSHRAGLKLTFRVAAGATAEGIAADLKAVYDRLNEYEISHGGKGLEHAARQPEQAATDGVIRWVLEATEPTGAAERLGKLVASLTPLDAVPSELVAGRSLAGCVAELIA